VSELYTIMILFLHFTFLKVTNVSKYLKFWNPSNTSPSIIRWCSKFVKFLFIFMSFTLPLFITQSSA